VTPTGVRPTVAVTVLKVPGGQLPLPAPGGAAIAAASC
jgi:hypothetical protein